MTGKATATRGNLPAELTSFIGRRRQLQDVKSALTSARLVTLVGPGGVGKTRLALRSATDLNRGIANGAWLVELEGLRDSELVTKAVMTSLGLRDESSRWPVSRLIDYVASKQLLFVLDNCEHLIDASAVLAETILREAPGLRILATSRQPLGVAGETVIRVGPLSVPEDDGQFGPERIAQSEAIALLVERAREAGAAFEVTPDNHAAVVELARRLDGIPLAIELASVRLRTLGLDQLVERLNDRFHLLVGGSRTAPSRHQTLEATIAWSHDLLGQDERALLRCLSVFAGSFSLEAAEIVGEAGTNTTADVLDVLTNLVERSFVVREGTSGRARYRLHETMREFALLRLLEADEEAARQERTPRLLLGPLPVHRSRRRTGGRAACQARLARRAGSRSGQHPRRIAALPGRPRWRGPRSDDGGRSRAVLENPRCERGRPLDRCPPRPSRWDDAIRSEALFVKIDLAVVKGTMRLAWRRPRRPARSHAA